MLKAAAEGEEGSAARLREVWPENSVPCPRVIKAANFIVRWSLSRATGQIRRPEAFPVRVKPEYLSDPFVPLDRVPTREASKAPSPEAVD